ncbi:ABC transporter substrate-binding protein [Nocardia spumae]|uniref:ABC transporter substrate-binding protein n=1 Tax=Nocardia spumae TaxID=2887190 RepID=UPI001D13C794|nr:ABC transporter substrate-binding protein [Nocardia spumae]
MIPRRLLLAVAVVAVVATACGSSDSDDAAVRPDGSVDLSQVTLRIGDQKGTGLQALLDAAGELRSAPYKIEWSQYTSGPPMLEAINSGAVDFGSVGNSPPVFAAAAGSDIKIVSAYRSGTAGQAILVPKDSPLRAPADLRGRKIAVTKGSSAHHHLLTVLDRNGLSFKDIQPQYLQPADALAALSSGKVDAWAIWDPYTALGQIQEKARILADGNGYINGDSFTVAGTKALASTSRTAAIRDVLARLQRAHEWADQHTDQWAQTFARISGIPLDVSTLAASRDPYRDHSLDTSAIQGEQQVADAFAEAGLIPKKLTMTDFIDTRFNDLYPTTS